MEAKKKMIVALTSLCSVLLVAVVTMGIVWAATSQTITSNVRVTYTATEVSGSIAANVYFNSDTAVAMTDPNNSNATTIAFDGNTSSTTGTLTPASAVALENADGQRFVIFEYVITNSSTNAMKANLTYVDDTTSPNVTDSNIKVYAYNAGTTQVSTPHTSVATLYGSNDANLLNVIAGSFFTNAVIAASTTNYFYIVVAIDNRANDAEFSGAFNWVLTKNS